MKVTRTRIARIVANRTLKGASSKTLGREVAAYLLSEGRVHELNSLLRDVQADWAEAGHVEVLAASAFPLTAQTKSDIERQIRQLYPTAQQIVVTEVHDAAIIGGVQLRLANQQLDLSIENKLNRFKQLTATGKD